MDKNNLKNFAEGYGSILDLCSSYNDSTFDQGGLVRYWGNVGRYLNNSVSEYDKQAVKDKKISA